MALEQYCASCTYLGEKADYNGKYWCSRKGQDVLACDARCYNWCEAYRRSTSCRENMYENSRSHSSSGGCYITTALCEILELPDNNHYLETLRSFRNNYLKMNRQYWGLLIAYDIIGPTIATRLSQDENKKEVAKSMLINYINPAVMAILAKKNDEAINIYTNMTNALATEYGIDSQTVIADTNNIQIEDPKTLGHGKRRVLVQN